MLSNADIQNMPDRTKRYRWFGHGRFNKDLYWLIRNMSLDNQC